MKETPASKTQRRVLSLIGKSAESYREAAEVLTTAGYAGDAIGAVGTWRAAAKMSDAELLSKVVCVDGPTRQMSAIDIIELGY